MLNNLQLHIFTTVQKILYKIQFYFSMQLISLLIVLQ